MMLNRNIAELIPDHGNMQWKQDAGVLMIELQGGGHQLKSIQVEAGQGGYG